MEIIYNTEKKEIIKKLSYYGITKIPFLLMRFGREKIRGYSGGLSIEEIHEISKKIGADMIGLYLFNEYDDEIRLSIDGIHILKEQITKNILELNEEETKKWFKGEDIFFKDKWTKEKKGFKILKNGEDFIGCGKLVDNRLINYLPKERRIKD